MFKVYLENRKENQGMWIDFPSGYYSRQEMDEKLGRNAELVIADSETSVKGLHEYLYGQAVSHQVNLRELDYLAAWIKGMDEEEKNLLQGALELEKPGSLGGIVNLTMNLFKFLYYPGVGNQSQLEEARRRKFYKEAAVNSLTQEEWGRDGCFTENGYVEKTNALVSRIYSGGFLTDPGKAREAIFKIELYPAHPAERAVKEYVLKLPATEEHLGVAKQLLRVSDLNAECKVGSLSSSIKGLAEYLPLSWDLYGLNQFARMLVKVRPQLDQDIEDVLLAALEADMPQNIEEATEIARRLDAYFVVAGQNVGPKDYAEELIETEQVEIEEEYVRFLDLEAMGAYCIKRDGAVMTGHGLVLSALDHPHHFSEELVTPRLFCPLRASLYERKTYEEDPEMVVDVEPNGLCNYEDKILESLEEDWSSQETERGLAEFLENKLLKRKVFSMKPTVETWQGELWGVLEVKSYGKLSGTELEHVTREWEGQVSDGWGEGFEQRPIQTEDGELYVSFWSGKRGYRIVSEKELKEGIRGQMEMGMKGLGL